jgi:hypothetical protein
VLAELGFDKLVIVRIDHRDKDQRKRQKTMEFFWQPYGELNNKIFTHITHGHYSPPNFLSNMIYQSKSNPSSYNVHSIYQGFKAISEAYLTNEILFLFGDDFSFQEPNRTFNNVEAMMTAFKDNDSYNDSINFFYSTPSQYFKALEEKKAQFPIFKDLDFFPYADPRLDYWTGYFTSRPYLKGLVRDSRTYIDTASELLLNYIVSLKENINVKSYVDGLNSLRREQNLLQHHDGVSGTSREEVAQDYKNRLNNGVEKVSAGMRELIESEIPTLQQEAEFINMCLEAVAYKDCINTVYTKSQLYSGILLAINNPKFDGNIPFKLKIEKVDGLVVKDLSENMKIDDSDLICDSEALTNASYCIVNLLLKFKKEEIFKIISLTSNPETSNNLTPLEPYQLGNDKLTIINNTDYILEYNPSDRQFYQRVGDKESFIKISHAYFTYDYRNDPSRHNRSGSYLMATDNDQIKPFNLERTIYYIGKTLTEINFVFEKSVLKIRIYPKEEFNYIIDTESIILNGRPNGVAEFLLTVNSNIENLDNNGNSVFYTDTNGLKVIKRVKNTREWYNFTVDDIVPSNFYPINSVISIKGQKDDVLNVYNDRAQGATSLNKGEILVDLNRWSDKDDDKGLVRGILEKDSMDQDFHINHWISLNNKSVHYLSKKPIYAVYGVKDACGINRMVNKFLNQYVMNRAYTSPEFANYRIKNLSGLIYEEAKCLIVNVYFNNEEEVLLQFSSNDIKDNCIVKMNQYIKYKVTSLSGLKHLTEMELLEISNKGIVNEYIIKPYEFLTVLVNLKPTN